MCNDDIYERFDLVIRSFDHIHNLSKSDLVRKIFNDAFEIIPEAEKGSYYELVGDSYIPVCSRGYDETILSKLSFKVEEAFIDFECTSIQNIEARQIFIESRDGKRFSEQTIEAFKALGTYENFSSLYSVIQADGKNVGMICLENFTERLFSSTSVRTLKFYAQLMSSYFAQKINEERIVQMHMETVYALVSSIEVSDPYTEGHGRRVSFYAKHLAAEMGLPQSTISELETAGLLHDIGKLGIPSEILNKPGKLSTEEYAIIRKHPENTRKILDKVGHFNRIREYTYCHHENFDGSGYPRGLKGDQIPFESQIISVVDAFDAMTSDRAYRAALSIDDAVEIILSQSGKQFRPEIVAVAVRVLPVLHQEMMSYDEKHHQYSEQSIT